MAPQFSIVELAYIARWYIAFALGGLYVWQSYRSYRRLSHVPGPMAGSMVSDMACGKNLWTAVASRDARGG